MQLDTKKNGNVTLDEHTQEQARDFLESLSSVNLDEVTTEIINVALRDVRYVENTDDAGQPILDAQGKKSMRSERYTRIAKVENYVPMKVFNRMLASRNRVTKLREQYLARNANDSMKDEQDPMLTWMLEQVHAVWQQSEPDMTLDRLSEGLTFEKISRLFSRFFGHLLQTKAT